MASYKDMLEEKMRSFNELKEKEETSLKALESLPINWKSLDKVETARAQLKEVFEICYENLYNSNGDYRLSEEPKPVEMQEEPMPTEIPEELTGLLEEPMPTEMPEYDEDNEVKTKIVCPICWETDHEPGANFCHICGGDLGKNESNTEQDEETSEEQEEDKKDKKNMTSNRDDEWNLIDSNGQYLLDL